MGKSLGGVAVVVAGAEGFLVCGILGADADLLLVGDDGVGGDEDGAAVLRDERHIGGVPDPAIRSIAVSTLRRPSVNTSPRLAALKMDNPMFDLEKDRKFA